jgi:hypothetical protein
MFLYLLISAAFPCKKKLISKIDYNHTILIDFDLSKADFLHGFVVSSSNKKRSTY